MNNYIIYKAQNTITGEIYVGATSQSIEQRRLDHIYKSNQALPTVFQEAIATYGINAFTWNQIDTASDQNELAEKEIQYIKDYDSFQLGYNLNKGGGGFRKKVFQYELDTGTLVGTYDNLASASEAINVTKKSISNVCLGIDKTCKGYYWSYAFIERYIPQIDLRKKQVIQLSLEGNLLNTFDSASQASKMTGVSKSCITRCCRAERTQSKGFLWRYI
nr:NUMOD1 domain-containing DNA-binding protein [uncultured Flavobacterium sp.]